MTRAIFYLTYNGVFNNTNGIGTQTKTFLGGMADHHAALCRQFGPFDVHLVSPAYDASLWGYSAADLAYARETIATLGGALHLCPYRTYDDEFWSPVSWLAVSVAAATTVLVEARRYEETLVIANDIPFLHVPLFIEQAKRDFGVRVRSLIALYGSSYVHTPNEIDPQRLAWERTGLATAASFPDVRIARFSEFMTRHFSERYGVENAHFTPARSSLHLEHAAYAQIGEDEQREVIGGCGLPLDRPLLFAFGRADWIKGFDLLLDAFAAVRDRAHLVLNVVPYSDDDPILAQYTAMVQQNGPNATLLTGYRRDLPQALCQWRNTAAVVCPSRGEPLSNIPFEVALWARARGPVLICANRDGFREQITDSENGFLFDQDRAGDLEAKLELALSLSEPERERLCTNAYNRVVRERDFYQNFRETLTHMWGR